MINELYQSVDVDFIHRQKFKTAALIFIADQVLDAFQNLHGLAYDRLQPHCTIT